MAPSSSAPDRTQRKRRKPIATGRPEQVRTQPPGIGSKTPIEIIGDLGMVPGQLV
jgi:hypothetical protein